MLGREGEEGRRLLPIQSMEKPDPLGIRPTPPPLQRGHFLPDPFPHPCVAPRSLRVKPSLHSPASSSAISSQRSTVLSSPTVPPLIPRSHPSPSHRALPATPKAPGSPSLPDLCRCQVAAAFGNLLPPLPHLPHTLWLTTSPPGLSMGTTSSQRSSLTLVQGQGPPWAPRPIQCLPLSQHSSLWVMMDSSVSPARLGAPQGQEHSRAPPGVFPSWPAWGLNSHRLCLWDDE